MATARKQKATVEPEAPVVDESPAPAEDQAPYSDLQIAALRVDAASAAQAFDEAVRANEDWLRDRDWRARINYVEPNTPPEPALKAEDTPEPVPVG